MTPRKPKPKPRKASGPTLEQRVAELEEVMSVFVEPRIDGCRKRIDTIERQAKDISEHLSAHDRHLRALDLRKDLRDKSHDEPVSNAGEAVGLHFRIVDELPRMSWWRRFFGFMGEP